MSLHTLSEFVCASNCDQKQFKPGLLTVILTSTIATILSLSSVTSTLAPTPSITILESTPTCKPFHNLAVLRMHTYTQPCPDHHHGSQKEPLINLRQQWNRLSVFIGRHVSGHSTRPRYLRVESKEDREIWEANSDWTKDPEWVGNVDSEPDAKELDDASTEALLLSGVGLVRAGGGAPGNHVLAPSTVDGLHPFSFNGMEVERITVLTRDGHAYEWSRPRNIMDWPEVIRKQVWRKAVVSDNKLMICDCKYCIEEDMSGLQPALAQVSKTVREEVLPIFYKENQFIFPIGHKREHGVRDWLDAIGAESHRMLRYLELAPLNADAAIQALLVRYRMRKADRPVVTEKIEFDDGLLGEVQWFVFTAEPAGAAWKASDLAAARITEHEATGREEGTITIAVGADSGRVEQHNAKSCASTPGSEDSGSWLSSDGTSITSSLRTVVGTTPPQLELRRPNGDEWGDPRWSFAGKFEDHLVKRLASRKYLAFSCFVLRPGPILTASHSRSRTSHRS